MIISLLQAVYQRITGNYEMVRFDEAGGICDIIIMAELTAGTIAVLGFMAGVI